MKRNGNQFRVSMQMRKLSAQRFVEVPHIVIPNLVRDPVFDPIEGRLFPAFSGFMFFSAERFLEHDAETSSA
ncbi:hypothetical protein V513_08255 [Mesotoga sp. H07.pep.5.3]|nr:hypothetical protein V513_08255 [Mesotoga sp. H07.pep.5.3]